MTKIQVKLMQEMMFVQIHGYNLRSPNSEKKHFLEIILRIRLDQRLWLEELDLGPSLHFIKIKSMGIKGGISW